MDCTGFLSYFSPSCYIESFSAAGTRGAARGTAQGLGQGTEDIVREVFQNLGKEFRSANMGDNLGKFIQNEGKNLFKHLKFDGTGEQFGAFLNKEGKAFLNSAGFDPAHMSGQTGKVTSEMVEEFIKNINTGKIGNDLGNNFDRFFEGIDMGGRAQNLGSEFRGAMDGFTFEIGEGMAEAVRNSMTGVRNEVIFNQLPYFLGASAVSLGTIYGVPLAIRYAFEVLKHNIGRPKLATEVNQIGIRQILTGSITNSAWFNSKSVKPTYDEETARRINEISRGVQNIFKNGGYFQNVLFYGPGGTGKTMISNQLAKESGLSYVKMSGGDLAQYIKRGEHVTELNKLFDKIEASWRPWNARPWLLFIDEAESLCKDRSTMPSAELLELQNAFLNRTGTQSKKFMMVLATNRMEDLDPAVLNRMDHKIFIGPPAEKERAKIIESYLPQFFPVRERQKLFTAAVIQDIASKIEGFTGRSIFKMLNAISNHRAMTNNNMLTPEIIMQIVNDFILQEKEVAFRKSLTAKEPAVDFVALQEKIDAFRKGLIASSEHTNTPAAAA